MIIKILLLDWRCTHALYKPLILLVFVFPLITFILGLITTQLLVIPLAMWTASLFSFSPFFAEEKNVLTNLYQTLPITRRQIVWARFLNAFFTMFYGLVMGFVITPIIRHFSNSMWYVGTAGNVALVAIGVLFYALMLLSVYPRMFKYGYEKGKTIGLVIPLCLSYLGLFAYHIFVLVGNHNITFEFVVFAGNHLVPVVGSMFAAAVLLFALTLFLSIRAYNRRDF